jgi:polyisoprenoid-binding protein YceI
MNKKMLFHLVLVFLIGLIGSPLSAASRSWEIDKDHTNFYFIVDHIFSKVQGRFTDYAGTIIFYPDNLKESEISFEIKVKSIDTGISKRDKHLRSKDFFNSSKYPLITFVSSSISKAGENIYNVSGNLTIKGVSTELILPLRYEGMKDHPFSKGSDVVGFNGHLSLDRLAYAVGMGNITKWVQSARMLIF